MGIAHNNRIMRLLSEMMYKIVDKRLQYIFANLL